MKYILIIGATTISVLAYTLDTKLVLSIILGSIFYLHWEDRLKEIEDKFK